MNKDGATNRINTSKFRVISNTHLDVYFQVVYTDFFIKVEVEEAVDVSVAKTQVKMEILFHSMFEKQICQPFPVNLDLGNSLLVKNLTTFPQLKPYLLHDEPLRIDEPDYIVMVIITLFI